MDDGKHAPNHGAILRVCDSDQNKEDIPELVHECLSSKYIIVYI